MKTRGLLVTAAALVVVVANGWGWWQAARNRVDARGGTLELTEREVPLQGIAFESSVTLLRLNWKTDGSDAKRRHAPAWLDTKKMAELGFDCSLPLNSPRARRHYSSKPARRVFLALEYQPEASNKAGRSGRANTGLVAVDADVDGKHLRGRYPDPQRHIISRGLVRLTLQRHGQDGAQLRAPVLEAWVEGLCPSQLSVPKPVNRLLTTLPRAISEEEDTSPGGPPRFSARVRWGRNYEPWVEDLRPPSN